MNLLLMARRGGVRDCGISVAVLTLAIRFLITERRKKRFPVLFRIFGVRKIRVSVGVEIHGKVISEGVVTVVAVGGRMGVAPVFRGLPNEGDVEQVGFVGIAERGLCLGCRSFDPLFSRQEKTISACLISNSLEFEGIKTGVVDALPDSEEQDGVFILKPLFDQRARAIEVPHHVCERNIVSIRLCENADGCALDLDSGAFGFAHVVGGGDSPGIRWDDRNHGWL